MEGGLEGMGQMVIDEHSEKSGRHSTHTHLGDGERGRPRILEDIEADSSL
jgi:hypothetical protein